MANLTITAANVVPGLNADIKQGSLAGVSITAGQVVYLNDTTKKWDLADNNGASALIRTAKGIALNSAAVNQPVAVQVGGQIAIGATVVVGTTYYLSDSPGAIGVAADNVTGEYVTIIGVAVSATTIALDISNTGVAVP